MTQPTEPTVKLSLTIPESLRDRIDQLAAADRRDRWNLSVILLEKGLAAWEADPHPAPLPPAPDPTPVDAL